MLSCILPLCAADHKIDIAVHDLSTRSVTQETVTIVSDRLRAMLIETGLFRVIERNSMNLILEEQGFQQSGACDESSCLVEAGQLLGVDRMIAGSIGRMEGGYTISLRMFDVASGEIHFSANEYFRGSMEDQLDETLLNISYALGKKVQEEPVSVSLNSATILKSGDGSRAFSRTFLTRMSKSKEVIADKKRRIRQMILGVATVIAGSWGLYLNDVSEESLETYQESEGYDQEVHQRNWDRYQKSTKSRNILYATSGVLFASTLISFKF
ncbi:MAG: CsgG/HfaB family protein [Reichenbachiella sp.]